MSDQASSNITEQGVNTKVSEEALLIQSLRRKQRNEAPHVQALCEQLLQRCEATFQRHARGLFHRPDLQEDVLANMREHLLREAMDPHEVFMTQNFPHYLQCLAREEFTRLLRQEGMLAYRSERSGKGKRPKHIPTSRIVPLPTSDDTFDREGGSAAWLATQDKDPHETLPAAMEVQRLIRCLHDARDRKILVLRALQGDTWKQIASVCNCSERTARQRYERICAFLRAVLDEEYQIEQAGKQAVLKLKWHPPTLANMSVRQPRL